MATYVVRAAEKLRRQRQRAAALTVYTRTSPFIPAFYSQAASTRLDLPSNDTAALLQAALPLVEHIFRPHRQLAKAGVLMQHLEGIDTLQSHLLVPQTEEQQIKRERLMQTIDRINHKYGRNSLQYAACGLTQPWLMKRERLGSHSTTRLDQIPTVHAR